jgi:hypothetical protein
LAAAHDWHGRLEAVRDGWPGWARIEPSTNGGGRSRVGAISQFCEPVRDIPTHFGTKAHPNTSTTAMSPACSWALSVAAALGAPIGHNTDTTTGL